MNKVLSVVIPAYNVEKTLRNTLESLLDIQVLNSVEIIIVNDGSSDATKNIASEFQLKYPNTVLVINKNNGGHGSTINEGLKNAKGKYFKVIDGDDWVDTAEFVKFVQKLTVIESDLLVNPYNKVYLDSNIIEKVSFDNLQRYFEMDIDDVIKDLSDKFQMHSVTFKTNTIQGKIRIDEHCYYVDQEYILYSLPYVKTVTFFEENVYQYRLGSIEQSMSASSMVKNRKMHEQVVLNLARNFENNKDRYSHAISSFLKDRINKLIHTQLNIYFSMDGSKDEAVIFWKSIQRVSPTIYHSLNTNTAKLMKLNPSATFSALSMIRHQKCDC